MWMSVFFTIATAVPLFVSLIFLSASIRHWKSTGLPNIFISASLFALAMSMFMLWSGQTFEWYAWLARSFWSAYPLVIPILFGFVLGHVFQSFRGYLRYVIIGFYSGLLTVFGFVYVRHVFTVDVEMGAIQGVRDVILGNSWEEAMYFPTGTVLMLFAWLIACIWMWFQERDRAWLALFCAGFIQLIVVHLQANGIWIGNGFILLLGGFITCMLVGVVRFGKRKNS